MDQRILKQRTALVLDQPFFGALVLRLRVLEDPTCDTMWVDGVTLGYNPAYVATVSDLELRGALAHDVLHVANGHCWRIGRRDLTRWNKACDYAINPIVKAAGMLLPEGALDDARFHGRSAEEIYAVLTQEAREEANRGSGGGEQNGPSDHGEPAVRTAGDPAGDSEPASGAEPSCGEVRPYPGPDVQAKDAEWKIATLQAAKAASMRGSLHGVMEAMVNQAAEPSVDWRAMLLRFAQQSADSDYSFARPNRRYLHLGFYLPSLYAPAVGDAVFVRDSSGSVFDETQAQFAAEITRVAETVQPARLIVLDCDVRVTQVQVFERGEPVELAPVKGGGGTSFTEPFRLVQQMDTVPAFLVYLTDMDGAFPDAPPDYPVLWASVTPLERARVAPFGETIEVIV
ncbi:vWA domain-containing protein [Paraburkholderia megapolitana]|uniref:vWA domain-containing protein n=1 Tax=Paraburkholderia megapolitana TaxID=420953 RepID=UPI0038BD7235